MAGVSGVNHLGESNGGYKYFEDSTKWIGCVISQRTMKNHSNICVVVSWKDWVAVQ